MSDPSVGALENRACRFRRPFRIGSRDNTGHRLARLLGQLQPFFLGRLRANPRAGNVQRRQFAVAKRLAVLAGVLPRRHRQGKGRNLRAAGIEFEAKEVFSQHRIAGFPRRQPLVVHPQRHQEIERRHQEMPAAAAGIKHFEFLERLRPAIERARGRRAIVPPSQIGISTGALPAGMPAPPAGP